MHRAAGQRAWLSRRGFRAGEVDGLIRADLNPRLATLSLLGSTNWVYRWFRPGGAFSSEQIGAEMAEMAILGIATERGLAEREQRRAAASPGGRGGGLSASALTGAAHLGVASRRGTRSPDPQV